MYRDFKELLSAFNDHKVKYLIVGACAVSIHAQPRATKDLDILVSPEAENAKATYAALAQFDATWQRRVEGVIDASNDLKAYFISRQDLIAAKLAAARPQDLADVDAIEKAAESRRKRPL